MISIQIYVILIIFILNIITINGFISSIRYNSRLNKNQRLNMEIQIGRHGQNFKYLPTYRANGDEYYPRTLPIAGTYPNITPEELFAVSSSPKPQLGTWSYDFIDPDGPQLGTVALPGSDTLYLADDPVILITRNIDLGIKLTEEVEVLLVIDRAVRTHDNENFFLYQAPNNELDILNSNDIIPDYNILGKVALVFLPYTESMRPKRTGFLEEDEE
uniref:Rubisco accumulation factor 1 C-terminal domain-containing protein n=1 Tax=Chromulina nebulosa TaxID=96789 RepID=A0A7S0SS11_9STRA|mmetsp:Transcript_1568/g.1399  ORF Transcript_1568/g.1399 Transcript_1568/m.1399 type:complete len:216 (+) Transcript_1568:19-666(+)